jgi:hypothetical protein
MEFTPPLTSITHPLTTKTEWLTNCVDFRSKKIQNLNFEAKIDLAPLGILKPAAPSFTAAIINSRLWRAPVSGSF